MATLLGGVKGVGCNYILGYQVSAGAENILFALTIPKWEETIAAPN